MTAVYIHIPFCKRRCNYCDFITYANFEAMLPDYLSALQMEILNSKWECDQAETVYIGGGTPSLMSTEQVTGILDAVRQRYGIAKDAEITVEANPGTVNASYYAQIRALGINRLSFGVQSFSDAELQLLGRIHSADEAIEQYFQAREAGFDNISLDLIYGLPEQTLSDWRKNLDVLKGLLPEHLSIYSLILEPGTLMTQWVEKGLVALPDDDLVADMFEVTLRTLAALGYEYYEISSWALGEARESRHNKVYWRGEDYLGFGAGAVGKVGSLRWRNTESVSEYIRKTRFNARSQYSGGEGTEKLNLDEFAKNATYFSTAVTEIETLSNEEQMNEMMMLGLRMTREGVSEKAFFERFAVKLEERYSQQISKLIKLGLVEWVECQNACHLRLTQNGYLLGNRVFQEFV